MEIGDTIKCIKSYKGIGVGESCTLFGDIMSIELFFIRGEHNFENISNFDLYTHFVLEQVCDRAAPIVFKSHL